MATELNKNWSRRTVKPFGHYKKKIVVTLSPGTDSRDDMIQLRLERSTARMVCRIADVYRLMALWHGQKEAAARKEARKNQIPWRKARKAFARANRID